MYVPGLGTRNRLKAVRQTGKANCFEAVVQIICDSYGKSIPSGPEIRLLANSNPNGTSLAGAKQCLENLGFETEIGPCTLDALMAMSRPVIALVQNPNGSLHYVVVLRESSRKIKVYDPADVLEPLMSHDKFGTAWQGLVIIPIPSQNTNSLVVATKANPWTFLFRTIWSQNGSVLVSVLINLLEFATTLVSICFVWALVSAFRDGSSANYQIGLLAGVLVTVMFRAAFCMLRKLSLNELKARTLFQLESAVSAHVQNLTGNCLRQSDPARLASHATRTPSRIGLAGVIASSVATELTVVTCLILVSLILNQLAMLLLAVASFIFICAFCLTHETRVRRLQRIANQSRANAKEFLQENLSAAPLLRESSFEKERAQMLKVIQLRSFDEINRAQHHKTVGDGAILFVEFGLPFTIAVGYSTLLYASPIQSIAAFAMIKVATGAAKRLSRSLAHIPEILLDSNRYLDIVAEAQQSDGQTPESARPANHSIRFENVVADKTKSGKLSQEINLDLGAHRSVQVFSSDPAQLKIIFELLAGKRKDYQGSILFDRQEIRQLNSFQLSQEICLVPTKPTILQTSIHQNICLGNTGVSNAELQRVAKLVGIDQFVQQLPLRYQSVIGRHAIATSWLEQFQLGLARASFMQQPIIVLNLPCQQLPDELTNCIVNLIHNEWAHRRIIALSPHPTIPLECDFLIQLNNNVDAES